MKRKLLLIILFASLLLLSACSVPSADARDPHLEEEAGKPLEMSMTRMDARQPKAIAMRRRKARTANRAWVTLASNAAPLSTMRSLTPLRSVSRQMPMPRAYLIRHASSFLASALTLYWWPLPGLRSWNP